MDVTKITMSKFTNIEIAILKRLHKEFTLEDLNKIVVKTITTTESYWDAEKRYMKLMKLYGLMPEPNQYGGYSTSKLTELTKYAKWTVDNLPEATDPYDESVDFRKVKNPSKPEMYTYEVNASESGSQVVYRSGWTEIKAWDQNDAEEKATEDFYDWGGEMEDDDYGDWYGDGIELDDITIKEQRRLARKYGIISHQPVRPGDMINEHIPQPGSSSAEGIKDDTLPYETKHLTLDEILTTVKSIPYYKEVLMDLRDNKDDWAVTQTVKRYAKYWMEHPESLTSENFPPIQVIGDGLKDGAHRISTLNALANHIDPYNSYWTDVKLEVRFYPIEIVKDIGPTWVNGKLVYNTKDGLKSKSLNESTLKINPELEVGDIVRVIDVDGEHARMPDRYGIYKVVKMQDVTMDTLTHEYYDIVPVDVDCDNLFKCDYLNKIKTLYRGDTWIYGNIPMATKVDRKTISETIMDDIPLEQFKENNPEVVEILDRFPETLQRELAVERKNPQEFVEDFKNYHLTSPAPNIEDSESTTITLKDELNKEHTIDTLSRTPQDVVDVVNKVWETDFESVKVFDPNPARYFEYAKFPGSTAKPSLMVNGKILYGVARFIAALLRGDETMEVWDITQKENINESTLKINPELEVGDKIRVISIDREVESKSIKYNIPPPELKPDLYVSYSVVGKESNGSESKYPFRYTLIPEDKYQEYLNGDYWVERDTAKLLFPWLNQWIYAKETETINENKNPKLNPELKIGDEIIVVDVGGTKEYMNQYSEETKPDKYIRYFVTKIYTGNKWQEFDQPYYGLNRPDVDVTDPDNPGVWDRSATHKYLYPRTDTWMFNPKGQTMRYEDAFQPDHYLSDEHYEKLYGDDGMDEEGGYLNEHKKSKFNPQLMVGDEVTVVNVDRSYGTMNTPKHLKDYVVIGIRYRQPENWEGPDADTKFYIIEPLSMTDDERLGGMLAGGGRRKEEHLYSTDTWMLKKGFLRGELGEHEEEHQSMSKDEVQTIVDKVYPHIINNLGESIYVDELPKVELWEDIYARLSKIPGATGEESESSEAQYDDKENKIFVYYPNMKDVKHVIQSLLHEYTHYLQDPDESEENRKDGYENDPYETAASEAEENWEDYMVYLKDNLNEKFASKAQQRFLYATNKKVAKKLGSKMTKKDYEELPDKVEEDLENWSYDGNSIGVEKELDEYCPMGKPNKCKLVDYNNLPDMVKSETIEEQFGKELTMADAIKRDVMKVLSMRFVLTPTEDSIIKDANGQSYAIVDTENPFEEVTIDMLIEPIINMFNDGISGGELSPEDTNIAISGVTDWLSLAMHQTVDLPN